MELLVVLAVLVILITIAFPFLQSSIEAGRSAKCVANLRTIGRAVQQFANEHNGRVLTWDLNPLNRGGIDDRWFQGLAPTIAGTNQQVQGNGPELNRIWSRLACPSVGEKYCSWHKATYAANSFQDPPWDHSLVLMQRIQQPSKTLYLVDGWVTFAASPGVDLPDPGWPPPGNWPGGPPNGSIDRWIFFPHRGKCNGLFLDGHVESFSGRLPANVVRP